MRCYAALGGGEQSRLASSVLSYAIAGELSADA
jgi:hypothetical protein